MEMAKFIVTITETLSREVFVEAEDIKEAESKVTKNWKSECEGYVLTADDFDSVQFNYDVTT